MPGIVVFNRRWSVGSDDLIIPAVILLVLHSIWIIVLAVILSIVEVDASDNCGVMLRRHILGFLVILCIVVLVEAFGAWLSLRGTILNTEPRSRMHYVLYVRLGVFVGEIVWQVVGVVWVAQHYSTCTHLPAKHAILGIIICNWIVMFCIVISIWCTFDAAGHSWVKLKRYQESLKGREMHSHQKRCSGNSRRNWRHRKAMRKYEQSWDRRCNILFCCIKDDKHQHSFTEVAKLFTEFFRDLDVVPSDIIAGLVLLRKHQKLHRHLIVSQESNDIYQFLSGVPITPSTKFVNLQEPNTRIAYKRVVHYMRYALAAYGWPVYMMMNTGTGLCKIMPHLHCSCCCYSCCKPKQWKKKVVNDNCCQCNFAALQKLTGLNKLDLVYATYHVDIGETPFFIAVDHEEKTIVISIRGTLSLQDVVTDLKADAEILPIEPVREDWLAHKGMVQAAVYIKKKIKEELLLADAFSRDTERGTQNYDMVVVGHSLGAGTAAILAIMMQQEFPSLHCYAYSPPGGLLSMTCVEETKSFITAVIVGKDFIPRIGLHQLEALRQDLINVVKKSEDPKWKIISSSMLCCCNDSVEDLPCTPAIEMSELMKQEKESRNFFHPSDTQIALSAHTPLFLPGKILHIVRNHNNSASCWKCGDGESVFEAIWAENIDFDEVLISPVMATDHLPDKVLEALEKVLTSPSVTHSIPCHSRGVPASREAALDGANNVEVAVSTGEKHSSLFVISSESQTVPLDSIASERINPTSVLESIFEAKPNLTRPIIKPMLSLPIRCDKVQPSITALHQQLHRSVPLASPEVFSESCSLSVLDSVGSFRSTKFSPKLVQMMNIRRSCSLPSSTNTTSLERLGFIKSSQHECNGTATQPMASSQNVNDSVHDSNGSSVPFRVKVDVKRHDTAEPELFEVLVDDSTFYRHSSDQDSPSHQLLYDDYLGHYSVAGRGYPHGFGYCLEHSDLPKCCVKLISPETSVRPEFYASQVTELSFCNSTVGFDEEMNNIDFQF